MKLAVLCSELPLEEELRDTVLWRGDVERHFAHTLEESQVLALAAKPDIVVVDRDLPAADRLIAALRKDPRTRGLSIVLLARGEFDALEVERLAAGANAILRLPPDPEWDERLLRLMSVPARKDVRIPVYFEIETCDAAGVVSALGTALNLSASGMLLESDTRLQVGDVLDLRFQLPGATTAILGCGRVLRLAGLRRFGVEFYGLEGDGAEEMRRFVAGE